MSVFANIPDLIALGHSKMRGPSEGDEISLPFVVIVAEMAKKIIYNTENEFCIPACLNLIDNLTVEHELRTVARQFDLAFLLPVK